MFIVTDPGAEDIEVYADRYEVDDDGHLLFFGGDPEREVGRVLEGNWVKVFLASQDEDEIEVELEDDK